MSEHPLCTDPACGACAQARATAGFQVGGPSGQPMVLGGEGTSVTCPHCGHEFQTGVLRVTEAVATEAGKTTAKAPYGTDTEYADPGYQSDGKRRYPLDSEDHVRAAWSYINQQKNAAKYSAADLKKVKARIKAAMKKFDIAVSENSCTEAVINGKLSFDDVRELVRRAVRAMMASYSDTYCWAYIVDLSDTDVVYMDNEERLFLCPYTLTDGAVTLGEPVEVVRTYAPVDSAPDEPAMEAGKDTVVGRVMEAKGKAADGGRVFRVQVIAYGDSKNGRRYPRSVMEAAVPLYEGAKAYDHHRTQEEMATGTIQGLVGYFRNAEAGPTGIEADLHLLPSSTLAAEALDASLAAQAEGLAPVVGISHDVYARFRPFQENGRQMQEATEVTSVNSADIVSTPAAGGQATRAVAGGTPTDPEGTEPAGESTKETDVAVNAADVLAALKEASDDQLAEVGLTRAGTKTTETRATEADDGTSKATEAAPDKATEADELHAKHTFLARSMIRSKVEEAELPKEFVKAVTEALPEQISEAMIDAQIAAQKSVLAVAERAGLAPTRRYGEGVTKDVRDKKIQSLDYFFISDVKNPDYGKGYRSFREAFIDITGKQPSYLGADFNRLILRESFGAEGGYDSEGRSLESMDASTWNLVLGDSITRRLVAEYDQPELMNWKQIVSSMPPINDFRTQRIDRIGGYGVLPIVNQGQPYQPLTSPTNQEISYVIAKRGGTEDITWEMVVNDDVRSIQKIPTKLGLAAAQTLYRFVWDIFVNNAATSYDSVALFHAGHNNTAATALSQSNLSAARKSMRKQTAYGDSSNVLSIIPKFLMVCSDLEELAFQLCTSAVAIPATPAGPTDTPNIHQGLTPITVDYWSSTTEWHLSAAPSLTPTIEVGFFQGRQLPELFTQADNTVGSMFNADKITYKIRHVYGSAVLDHVGLYRGNS